MTNDIIRLRDALTRDNDDALIRDRINRNSTEILSSLRESGEYRIQTPKGTILIRSTSTDQEKTDE